MRASFAGHAHPSVPRIQHVTAVAVLGAAALLGWARILAPTAMDGADAMAVEAVAFAPMWLAMIAAMMLPTIEPMFATYLALTTGTAARRALLAGMFLLPYVAVWSAAGSVAYALRVAAMDQPLLVPGLVALAGLYQLGGIKDACLRACRTPLSFILRHGVGRTVAGAMRLGARHAAVCLGCCAGLMVALAGAGAVDPLWMAALGALMLAEKTLPHGATLARASGVALLAAAPLVILVQVLG